MYALSISFLVSIVLQLLYLCTVFRSLVYRFLGGLSLHLNHLIQSRMEIYYRLFGTLPIGLLLSNLDSRQP